MLSSAQGNVKCETKNWNLFIQNFKYDFRRFLLISENFINEVQYRN